MSKKISFGKWGRLGRKGNMMFELSALYGMAKRYNREPELPSEWMYQHCYKHQVKIGNAIDTRKDVCEPAYEFTGWEYWDRAEEGAGETMSISGWLQSSKYFNKEITKDLFEFTWEFQQQTQAKLEMSIGNIFNKPVILIGFRVGKDYVDNGNYEILSPLYQVSALYKHFPNWREEYNILVFSDDYQYAKLNMDCHENIYFADGFSDIEQMYLGTLCTHFILPNSTFSWWQAYLGEKEGSVVIHPSKYFKGYLQTISDTKDLWEKHWVSHNYKGELLDMKDVCFTIPVKYDHEDRKENLQLIFKWINSHFSTFVCLGEQGGSSLSRVSGWTSYIGFPEYTFHRTKFLNRMAQRDESIIINFDCDNICPIMQIIIGVDMIRKGEADGVYPYDGRVARVNRKDYLTHLYAQNGDCGIFGSKIFKGTRAIDPLSVGHIIIWNREKFFEGGGENENFISYGPEDVERYERFDKLGYIIKRVRGIVYHIDHWCGPDSSGMNPNFGRNYDELDRIRKMTKEELKKEINGWKQTKKGSD